MSQKSWIMLYTWTINMKEKSTRHTPLTVAAVIRLGVFDVSPLPTSKFWAGWYSGSLILSEMKVMIVYSRMTTTVVYIIKWHLNNNKTTILSSALRAPAMTFKGMVLLHSHYIISYGVKSSGPILGARAGQHQYNLAAWTCEEIMWLSVRTLKY